MKRLPQTGRDLFTRGDPEAIQIHSTSRLEVDLYALIAAYARQRTERTRREYRPGARIDAYPLEAARDRLRELAPSLDRWTSLRGVAPQPVGADGPSRASYVASTLSASLELVREGELEARQLEAFADLYLRARPGELFEGAA